MASSNTCRPEPTFSFTQGLIVGQLSVVLLVAAFIRFFIFGDPPSAEAAASQRASERRARTEAHRKSLLTLRGANRDHLGSQAGHANPQDSPITSQAQQPSHLSASGPFSPQANLRKSSVLRRPSTLTIASILNKTYYRVDSHQPESLDWFNVLIAQTIAQFRHDAQHDDAILTSLTKALNGTSRPDFVDEIRVTELSLGEGFPIFSNCRIIPVDEDGLGCTASAGDSSHAARLQARMDVDLSDMITLAVETKLLLNYPRRLAAVLPVALAVSVVRFSGTLSVSFVPSNPSQATPTKMIFAFLDDYRLDFSIRSLLGSRSRLQDVPKIAQLIESRLHRWFDDRAVEPRFQEIELPSLWPRMKNTRGGGSGGAAGSSAASGISAVAGGAPGAAAEDTLPPIGGPSIIPGSASAADRALLNKGRPANSLDALRRPESRDSKDSRETRDPRDVRDLRKEVETENWVERQQHPAIQLLAAASQQGQSSQSQSSPLSTTMRYRPPLSRHDDAFSMPGSLPDISMDPHG